MMLFHDGDTHRYDTVVKRDTRINCERYPSRPSVFRVSFDYVPNQRINTASNKYLDCPGDVMLEHPPEYWIQLDFDAVKPYPICGEDVVDDVKGVGYEE